MSLINHNKMNFKGYRLAAVIVLLAFFIYYCFASISIGLYPGGFDIMNDLWTHLRWYNYNPLGAFIFRIGSVIYGISVIIFFIMFDKWMFEGIKRTLARVIQGIGMVLGFLIVITEFLADIEIFFTISSGLVQLLTICLLIIVIITLFPHPKFWRWFLIIFVINIGFNFYLLYLGITGSLITEFRIIDLLVTLISQISICSLAINMLIQ